MPEFFWWAEFRKTKGGVKPHTFFDVKTPIPRCILITKASVNDMNVMDLLKYEPGSYYILNRCNRDYERLYRITRHSAYFVTRIKKNLRFKRMFSDNIEKNTGVLSSQTSKLEEFYSLHYYPDKLQKIRYYDEQTDRTFEFMTNKHDLMAHEIALLYKDR
jgi:hypothetical protein